MPAVFQRRTRRARAATCAGPAGKDGGTGHVRLRTALRSTAIPSTRNIKKISSVAA